MTKRMKFIVATLVMALGFFFCISMVSVSADGGDEVVEQPQTTETEEETNEVIDLFLNHLKDLKWEEAEAIITAICVKLGIDTATIFGLIIFIVWKRTKEARESQIFQNALAKLEKKYQDEINNRMNNLENRIETAYKDNQKFIAEQTAIYEELQSDSTKQITEELKQTTELLK